MIKTIQRLAIVLLLGSAIGSSAYADGGYREVSPPQPPLGNGKIEVLEFFWFGCPHCYQFHPVLEQWKKTLPDDVIFRPVAAVLNPSWANHARAYYAAEILGVADSFQTLLFDALHKHGKRIFKLKDLADFAAEQGIDRAQFLSMMQSFAVETQLLRSQQLAAAYKIDGVPTVAVAGKYITSGTLAGSYPRVIEVIDQLIERTRAPIE